MKTTTCFYRSLVLGGIFTLSVLCGNPLYAQFGDNLGKHKADRALDMNAKNLTNVALLKYKTTDVGDKSTGDIGSAATTVDLYTVFEVPQSTAGQALTLPAPTTPFAGQVAYVKNTGSASFTMYGATIAAGAIIGLNYNGTAWTTPSATALGGDISGTLAASTVDKLKNASLTFTGLANNNLLQYNGTDWVNAAPSTLGTIGLLTGTTGTDVNVSGSPATLGSSITLNIPDAGTGVRGLVTTAAQALEGVKTFNAAPILNTLTAGSIPFIGSDKSISQNNPNLFWDNTNTRLGIGTPTPGATLHNAGSTVLGTMVASNTAATYAPTAATTVDVYSGLILTQTTAVAAVTLPTPTVATTGRIFTLTNSASSTYPITVGNTIIPAGASCVFNWDGATSAWLTAPAASTTLFASFTTAQTLAATYYGYTISWDATSAAQINTLPTAVGHAGQFMEMYKADNSSNTVAFQGASGQTIGENAMLYLFNKGDVVTLRSDGTNWIVTSTGGSMNASSAGSSKSYLQATFTSTQSTNLAAGVDHFKYQSVTASNGSDIILDISTAYTSANNAASLGRFTLKAGKTYRLVANFNDIAGSGSLGAAWFNADTGVALGNYGYLSTDNGATATGGSGNADAVFTPGVDTRVEVRIGENISVSSLGVSTADRTPTAYIETLSTPATVVNTVDYVFARPSASVTTGTTVIPFTTAMVGNISISGNSFTLLAGKTYELEAFMDFTGTTAGGMGAGYGWTDSGGTLLTSSSLGFASPPQGQWAESVTMAKAVITPTETMAVKLMTTATSAITGLTLTQSYVKIIQIGSTAMTGSLASSVALNTVTQATATNSIDNVANTQSWSWNSLTSGSGFNLTSSNATLNSTDGIFSVKNTGTSTNGKLATFHANSIAGSGLNILTNGNVGIGTSTPSWALSVVGTDRYICELSGTQTMTDNSNQLGLMVHPTFSPTTTTVNTSGIYVDNIAAPPSGVNITKAMGIYVTPGGTLGTGTVTNGYGLYVDNPGYGTNKYAAYFGGNVGVGATAPAYPLDVFGTGAFGATGGFEQTLIGQHEVKFLNGGSAHFSLFSNDDATLSINNTSGDAALGTSGTALMTIAAGGNVGIGQTLPSGKLDITNTTTGISALKISTNAAEASGMVLYNSAAAFTNSLLYGYTQQVGASTFKLLDLRSNSGGTQSAYIDGLGGAYFAGAVGIGCTPATDYILDVRGTGKFAGVNGLRISGTDGGNTIFQDNLNTNLALTTNGGDILFGHFGVGTDMLIKPGKVGIGTGSPNVRLSLGASVPIDAFRIYDAGAGASYGMGIQASELQMYVPSASHFSFNGGGNLNSSETNEVMRIMGTGNVGIGTSYPGARLHIQGNSATTEAIFRNADAPAGKNWNIFIDSNNLLYFRNESNVGVAISDGATAWTAASDRRLKKNIVPLDNTILDRVMKLNPITYRYKADDRKEQVGFIAQEVEEAGLLDVVDKPATDKDFYGLQYSQFAPYLVKALQQMNTKLEAENVVLKARLEAIEKKLGM